MHIEDGILPLAQTVAWDAVALAFVIPGIKQAQKKAEQNPAYKPLLAMMGAAVFVVSAMHLPVPVTGSCSHPCATPLAAIVLGPFATAFISSIVLFFQAIFLGHGGITTLGANTFSMGIVGGFSGYLMWWGLRRGGAPIWLAGGLAGLVGDLMTYATSALELAIPLHGQMALWKQWLIFFLGYGPTQFPLAVLEAVFTAAALTLMAERRPDLLPLLARRKKLALGGKAS